MFPCAVRDMRLNFWLQTLPMSTVLIPTKVTVFPDGHFQPRALLINFIELLGRWLKQSGRRDNVFLATKFGNIILPDGGRDVRGDAAYVKEACENSLHRLGVETIDLYYAHRCEFQVTSPLSSSLKV